MIPPRRALVLQMGRWPCRNGVAFEVERILEHAMQFGVACLLLLSSLGYMSYHCRTISCVSLRPHLVVSRRLQSADERRCVAHPGFFIHYKKFPGNGYTGDRPHQCAFKEEAFDCQLLTTSIDFAALTDRETRLLHKCATGRRQLCTVSR